MDKDFDEFKSTITTFYRKVIRVHESKLALINSFSKMNEKFAIKYNESLSMPPIMRKNKIQKDKEL